MEIKQLLTFQTAAENLNFTKTARELNFAQSSVTAQIKSLESELGTPLFERLGKHLVLTDAGRRFKKYADQMIKLTDEAKMSLNSEEQPAGTLIIGAQESQCTYRLPPILKAFKNHYPYVKLVFKPAHSNEMARSQLLNGELDIAFIMDLRKPGNAFNVELLVREEMQMVAAPDHPLITQSRVFPKHLQHEKLLLTEEGCSYRTLLEESFRSAGVYPIDKFEFVSVEAIKQCVIAGLGIAYLPAMVVRSDIQAGRMKVMAWKCSTPPIFTQIAWHKDKQITPPLEAFINLTRKIFKTSGFYPTPEENNLLMLSSNKGKV